MNSQALAPTNKSEKNKSRKLKASSKGSIPIRRRGRYADMSTSRAREECPNQHESLFFYYGETINWKLTIFKIESKGKMNRFIPSCISHILSPNIQIHWNISYFKNTSNIFVESLYLFTSCVGPPSSGDVRVNTRCMSHVGLCQQDRTPGRELAPGTLHG